MTPSEYAFVHELAQQRAPAYVAPAMEIAYLCHARRCEVLALRREDLLEDGILLRRTKGSKTQIIGWTPRLRAAIDAARNAQGKVVGLWVIGDRQDSALRSNTFGVSWQRLMTLAMEQGLRERFTFHDLKAAAVSDFEGDKRRASGHRSWAQVEIYDRRLEIVRATS